MSDPVEALENTSARDRGFGGGPRVQPIERGARGAALLIANWEYAGAARLHGPKRDLPLVEAGLRKNRFHVTAVENVKRPEHLIRHVADFVDRVLKSREPQHGGFSAPVFIYYAGHGARSPRDDKNYILPVNTDFELFLRDPGAAACLDDIMRELNRLTDFSVAFILDACRDIPETRGASTPALPFFNRQALDKVDDMRRDASGGPSWLGLVFSTQPGEAAADTMAGANSASPFAHAFARCLRALPWRLRPRRLDDLFRQDVKKIFERVEKRGQTIVVSQAGQAAPPAIGAHAGRRVALLGGIGAILVCATATAALWRLREPPPVAVVRPSVEAEKPEETPAAAPSSASAAEQRLQGRLRLSAAEDAARADNHPVAAGLALSALDLPGFAQDETLRAEAAALLHRQLAATRGAESGFSLPGLPDDGGQYQFLSAFSDDGARFAIQAGESAVRVYDTQTGALAAQVEAPARIDELAFSPDGRTLLLVGDARMTFHQLDAGDPRQWSLPLAANRTFGDWPALSADGRRMADTLDPSRIVIRDTTTGTAAAPEIALGKQAVRPRFSPDGTLLAALVPGEGVIVWTTATGGELMRHSLGEDVLAGADFSDDGRYLLVSEDDSGTVAVLDISAHKALPIGNAPAAQPGASSYFLNADNDILTLESDGTLAVWNPVSDQVLTRFSAGDAAFHQFEKRDGGDVIAMETADGRLVAWRWRRQEKLIDRPVTWQRAAGFSASRSGYAVHVVEKGRLLTIPLTGGGMTRRIPAFDTEAHQFAVSPDGRRFAASSTSGTRLWDMLSGRLLMDTATQSTKPGDTEPGEMASALAFSRDSSRLFIALPHESGGPIAVVDTEGGQPLPPLQGKAQHASPVSLLAFSGMSGALLYSAGIQTFIAWDLASGGQFSHYIDIKDRRSIFERTSPGSPAENPAVDVHAITVDPVSWNLSVIDVANGTRAEDRKWMRGHSDYVLGTLFDHSGALVVSFSRDKTVRVWDVATGNELARHRVAEGIRDVAVSDDDTEVRILTEDAGVKRWRWRDDRLIDEARFDGCSDSALEDNLLLCRDETDTDNTPAVLRAIRAGSGIDVIARFAGDAALIDGGRHVLEPGETATLYPTFASLEAMKDAARARMTPHRDAIEAALAALH